VDGDLVEIAVMHDLKIPAEEFDIDGDAVAPGQAIGGARVLVALLNGLGLTGGRRGGRLFWRRRRGGRPRRRDIRLNPSLRARGDNPRMSEHSRMIAPPDPIARLKAGDFEPCQGPGQGPPRDDTGGRRAAAVVEAPAR